MILWENYKKICFLAPFGMPSWPNLPSLQPGILPANGSETSQPASRAGTLASSGVHAGRQYGWPCVGSGTGRKLARVLARRGAAPARGLRTGCPFGQNAIYWIEGGQLWLVPVLSDKSAVCLGDIAAFWIVRANC